MNILITGGTGFLGSYLVKHFVERSFTVTVLARETSSIKRLVEYKDHINILRYSQLDEISILLGKLTFDCIINTACSYGRAGECLRDIISANFLFPLAVLEAGINSGVKSFINTGTILDRKVNAYSLSKTQFSEWGESLSGMGKIQFIDVMLEHMYGPGDDASKFVTHIIKSCLDNIPELELTTGDQRRDFIYIGDVVTAYDAIADNLGDLGNVEKISVGSGYAGTIRNLVEKINYVTESTTSLKFGALPYRKDEVMVSKADTSRLESLGWKLHFDLDAGLKHTVKMEKIV